MMDTAVRWSSLVTPLFINTTSGIVVCQNQRLQNSFLHGRTHWSCWSAQKWCGHRGEFLKIGALEENVPELLVNGTNVFGTLALQLPNNEEDGGSILSDQISRAADFTHQDDDESNEYFLSPSFSPFVFGCVVKFYGQEFLGSTSFVLQH